MRRTRLPAADAAAPRWKQPHGLHGQPDVLDAVALAGLDIDALVAELVVDPATVSVLLVGSLAEGLGTAASDVDLLLLADSPAEQRTGGVAADDVVHRDAATVEYRRFDYGLEINPEVAFRSEMRPIVGAFLELAPLLYQPEVPVRFPRLTPRQLRMLHRLRTGVVWRGPEQVELWRDELYTQLLASYLTLLHVDELDRTYEQAVALSDTPDRSPTTRAMARRRAGEAALLAGLASVGVTNPSLIAGVELASRVDDPDVRPLLDLALQSMFAPPAPADAADESVSLTQLGALRDAVDARVAALGLDRARVALASRAPVLLPSI